VVFAVLVSATALAQPKGVGVSARDSGRRLALVIGNGAYREAPKLGNPVNDARDMAAALERVGFTVTLLTDAAHRRMEEAIDAFGLALRPEDVGLFYYSGHGVQVRGENYLIPVDANPKRATVLKFEAVNAARVLGMMEAAGNRLNLVILDACRNNPFKGFTKGLDPGLARMDAPSGTLLAYATAPGQVAEDGAGRNSPYTAALLRHLPTPALKVEDVFKRVRTDVERATRKAQTPWEATSLKGDFYFAGGSVAAAPAPQPPEPAPAPPASGFSLSDLEAEAKKEAGRLAEMQQAFGEVQAFEQRPVAPALKSAAWHRFLAAFERDNPYSGEDDRLRGEAGQRVAHWTAEQERAERRPRVAAEVRAHIAARRLGRAQELLERESATLGEPLLAALRRELEAAFTELHSTQVWRDSATGRGVLLVRNTPGEWDLCFGFSEFSSTCASEKSLTRIALNGGLIDVPWQLRSILLQNRNKIEWAFINDVEQDWHVKIAKGQVLPVDPEFQPHLELSGERKFAVQLASMREMQRKRAETIVRTLMRDRYYAYVYQAEDNGKAKYRIRSGFYDSEARARAVGAEIRERYSKENYFPEELWLMQASADEQRGENMVFGAQLMRPWVVELRDRYFHAEAVADLRKVRELGDFAYIWQTQNPYSKLFVYRVRIGFFASADAAKKLLSGKSGEVWIGANLVKADLFAETLLGQLMILGQPRS
jgi:uncharacterized caspase-like protein